MIIIIENGLILLSLISSVCVIYVSNPILSLLCLILSFMLSSMLFLIMGLEFISLLIFMVYVGAIAVLFLFVIMMLNIKILELRSYYLRYLPVSSFIIIFFFFELCLFFYIEFFFIYFDSVDFIDWIYIIKLEDNIFLISSIIYTYYSILFFCLAIILLIAMIGSIVLIMNWGSKYNKDLYYNVFNYKYGYVKFFSKKWHFF